MESEESLAIRIPESNKPRVVIVGGGFAGIQLSRNLKNKGVQVVMLDRHNYHTFQPLLYQVATAGLEPDSIAGPLRKVIENYEDFYFRLAKVEHIDGDRKTLKTSIGEINYDYLVIANGTKTNYFGNEKKFEKAFPLKQVPQALDLRSHILQNFEQALITDNEADREELMTFVIVGGGPTGVELAGAMGELKKHVLPHDYPELNLDKMKIYLVEGMDRLLLGMSDESGDRAMKYLKKFEVDVYLNKMVASYDGETVKFNDDSVIKARTLVWGAGVQGNVISGIRSESVEKSRILVDTYNRVQGYESIFAIGDIALMKSEDWPKGHPMLAPVAIQQGKHLADNIGRLISKRELKPFEYTDKGSMATVGRNKAVADLPGKMHLGGFVAWLIWMFIHLISIIGFRNKLVVFSNWVWNYFTYDRGTRLIIRPYVQGKTPKEEHTELPIEDSVSDSGTS
ncbi:NAD(P)/FAD-dependent oxidoreductase [Roseivirga sp. BDSF3-8]|uniref:NAD(P)/FAD-dependent oxidoreductase n=1 Tax=Roseivirga sp. BDSF3-8 TaxID=3241598 RepID=UPI003531813A